VVRRASGASDGVGGEAARWAWRGERGKADGVLRTMRRAWAWGGRHEEALRASDQRERETEDMGSVDVAGGEGARASRQASEASAGVARVRTASPR